ncbi:MAG: RNA polymerase sigma factor [Planctomycetota bacterium]
MSTESRVRAWLNLIRMGDGKAAEGAKEELLRLYRPRIRDYVATQSRARKLVFGDCSDVTQDVCRKAYDKIGFFKGDDENTLWAWLKQIAAREVISKTRGELTEKRNRQRTHGDSALLRGVRDEQAIPPDKLLSAERRERIHAAIRELSRNDQKVIELRFFHHKSYKEIGELLDVNPNTITRRCLRAIEKLRLNSTDLDGFLTE